MATIFEFYRAAATVANTMYHYPFTVTRDGILTHVGAWHMTSHYMVIITRGTQNFLQAVVYDYLSVAIYSTFVYHVTGATYPTHEDYLNAQVRIPIKAGEYTASFFTTGAHTDTKILLTVE